MKNLLAIAAVIFFVQAHTLTACTDIFICKNGFKVEGRTMDFPINMATMNTMGFIGQKNTTDIVIDADKIPLKQLASWTNKYGYFGRSAFKGPKMVDGMNTEGFSAAFLYLPGSVYPTYDSKDNRPVLGAYDLLSFLLAQAKDVEEALKLINAHQIVAAAVEVQRGYFLKDIPLHVVMRDKSGNSAVLEYIKGKVTIYKDSGNVLTNEPAFDWQVQNARYYDSLSTTNEKPNPQFVDKVFNYDEIFQLSTRKNISALLGTPGDYTPASRFAKADILLKNLVTPQSTEEALYQASAVLDAVAIPTFQESTATIWKTIKDLDKKRVYIKELGYFQGEGRFFAMSITGGYTMYDLNTIDFKTLPVGYIEDTIQPTNPQDINEIISVTTMEVFQ